MKSNDTFEICQDKIHPNCIMKNYGRNIKKVRERMGVTAASLAEKLGWSRSKMSSIETGTSRLFLEDAEAIANALGFGVGDLISEQWEAKTTGERIRVLRRDKGWTQEQLADRLSVFRVQVSAWERDRRTPSVTNILRLSKVFGVTVDFLESGDEKEYKLDPISDATLETLAETLAVADKIHPGMAEGFLMLLEEGLLRTPEDLQDLSDLARIMRRRASGK